MIVNAKRAELLALAQKASVATAANHPMKELAGVLLETNGREGIIRVTATNLDVAIRGAIPAAVEKDGSAVINAKLLIGALGLLPGEDVYLELKDNWQVFMKSGQSDYLLSALDGKGYPNVDIPYPGATVSVKGLKSLINRSIFAAAALSPSNPVLSCVNLTFSESGVKAAASDGTCAVQVSGDPEAKGNASLLVPASSLKLLAAIAVDGDVYELGVTGKGDSIKNVVVSDGTTLFSARVVDGKYLDTDTLFQSIAPVVKAAVSAEKLRFSLREVSSIAGAGGRVEFTFDDAGLKLRCVSEKGSAASMLEAAVSGTTDRMYCFVLKNLAGCAVALKGSVTLGFTKDGMLEIQGEGVRYFQTGVRPAVAVAEKPIKAPRKKPAAA